jgi:hypothetical protein
VRYIFALEPDADEAGISGASVITDGAQHLQLAFRMRQPELIYIQPDGYIGLRTQDLTGSTLRKYLALIYAMTSR